MESHFAGTQACGRYVGAVFSESMLAYRGTSAKLYWDRAQCDRAGAAALRLIKSDPGFIPRFRNEALEACDRLLAFRDEVGGLDAKSNDELAALFMEIGRRHALAMKYGFLPNLLDYASHKGYNILAEELEDYLLALTSDRGRVAHAMSVLTTPEGDSWPVREHKAFLKMASELLSSGNAVEKNPSVERQAADYGWISFLFIGPVKWTRAHYVAELEKMLSEKRDPEAELKAMQEKAAVLPAGKKRLLEVLGIDAEHARLFGAAAAVMYVKSYRKDVFSMSWYCLDLLATEAVKRIGVSHAQAQFMFPSEISSALSGGPADKTELDARMKECVFVTEGGVQRIVSGKEARLLSSAVDALEAKPGGMESELKGTCACPGRATGPVRRIEKAGDMAKMRKGDILVAHMTQPEIVVAMKKAGAIVTDMGGLTCHAAIVSRELGIPCVIGTKIATKVFKDGDLVEVDATKGIVRRL
jgi:phosphohistidine swiveling domain-containing protein